MLQTFCTPTYYYSTNTTGRFRLPPLKLSALKIGTVCEWHWGNFSFLLHFQYFTVSWQLQLPAGSSKTLPHSATKKKFILVQLLTGRSWPTLKEPSLDKTNQEAELVWIPFTSPLLPAPHRWKPQRWTRRSTQGWCILLVYCSIFYPTELMTTVRGFFLSTQEAALVMWDMEMPRPWPT